MTEGQENLQPGDGSAHTENWDAEKRQYTRETRKVLPGVKDVLFMADSSTDITIRRGDESTTQPVLVTRFTSDGIPEAEARQSASTYTRDVDVETDGGRTVIRGGRNDTSYIDVKKGPGGAISIDTRVTIRAGNMRGSVTGARIDGDRIILGSGESTSIKDGDTHIGSKGTMELVVPPDSEGDYEVSHGGNVTLEGIKGVVYIVTDADKSVTGNDITVMGESRVDAGANVDLSLANTSLTVEATAGFGRPLRLPEHATKEVVDKPGRSLPVTIARIGDNPSGASLKISSKTGEVKVTAPQGNSS